MMAKVVTEGILAKLRRAREIVKFNGGVKSSLYMLFRTDELKIGELVGEDKYGNKYYRNDDYFVGRNKWVIYSDKVGLNYDGSQVPAEWHRWLSDMCDTPPTVKPPIERSWTIDHVENKTGTNEQYVPYSTTRPKIQAWQPPKAS